MSNPRIDRVAAAIEARFPGTTVIRRPCPDSDAHDIACMLHVLNAPKAPPLVVLEYALDFAYEIYREDPLDFMVDAVGREDTRRYFPDVPLRRRPAAKRRRRVTSSRTSASSSRRR